MSKLDSSDPGRWQKVRCPFPDHKNGNRKDPAFSVLLTDQAFKCHGCGIKGSGIETLRALSRSTRFPLSRRTAMQGEGGTPSLPQTSATLQPSGCTLKTYAKAKHLPEEFLRQLGLSDMTYLDCPAVRMPFLDRHGQAQGAQFRVALTGDRIRTKKDAKLGFYGLNRHEDIRTAGWVLFVEGPSNCHTAWHHKIPALGMPGKGTWATCWERCPDEIKQLLQSIDVVVWQDPDATALPGQIAANLPKLRVIRARRLTGIKDLSDVHVKIGAKTPKAVEKLKSKAIPWTTLQHKATRQQRRAAWIACRTSPTTPPSSIGSRRTSERVGSWARSARPSCST